MKRIVAVRFVTLPLERERSVNLMQRLIWFGIYFCVALLLAVLGHHLEPMGTISANGGGKGRVLFMATFGFAYLGAVVCFILSLLALIGKLPHVPEDEPNI